MCRAPHRRWAMSLLLLLRRRLGPEDRHWCPCRSTTAADSRLLDAPPLLACKCKAAACRRPHGGAKRSRAQRTACLRRVPLLDRHAATDRLGGLPPSPQRNSAGTVRQVLRFQRLTFPFFFLPHRRAQAALLPYAPKMPFKLGLSVHIFFDWPFF